MIVTREKFDAVVEQLSRAGRYAVDTETTGLRPYHGDRLFSIIVADQEEAFYFNFQAYEGLDPEHVLPRAWILRLEPVFANPESLWYAHNAKFDLHMLAREGLRVSGVVHCTEANGRLLKNNYFSGYSLAESAKRIGLEKSAAVDQFIQKNKLFTKLLVAGKQIRVPHFDRVPFEIIAPYGEQDARITWSLGEHQVNSLYATTLDSGGAPTPFTVMHNERKLTKVCFDMEQTGILTDRRYTERAFAYEQKRAEDAKAEFKRISGAEFVDSGKALAAAFTNVGEAFPRTEKGNPSFTDAVLAGFKTPLARVVQDYRDAAKKANTYYGNFLRFADAEGAIHPNMRQGGTETGRFSYSDPNLQNLNKEEDTSEEFLVRRCFIPRPGHCFVMIDFDQMEYRLMLDYAGEDELIQLILGGLDVHDATAKMMGVKRSQAKTINFGLLYGSGAAKLAGMLGVEIEEAQRLRNLYFQRLPMVKYFIRRVSEKAKTVEQIRNWAGRRYHFDNPEFAYIAPNHLIQGGCADIVKFAMVKLHDFLREYDTRMLVQVHDEILFEVPEHELHIVPELKRIMEETYPARKLPLTCGVEHSFQSWADKKEGVPCGSLVS